MNKQELAVARSEFCMHAELNAETDAALQAALAALDAHRQAQVASRFIACDCGRMLIVPADAHRQAGDDGEIVEAMVSAWRDYLTHHCHEDDDACAMRAALAVARQMDGSARDAERYRALRGTFGIVRHDVDDSIVWHPDEIDEAVDAARAKVAELRKDVEANEAYQRQLCDMLSTEAQRAEAAEAKVARLREAAIVALNYIESAEREVGIMSCGEALRRALGPQGGAA